MGESVDLLGASQDRFWLTLTQNDMADSLIDIGKSTSVALLM